MKTSVFFEHLQIMIASEGNSAISKEYGINSTSILNELNFFHVSSGGLLPDIMHDILEGALAYESKLMLERCIRQEKYFQLADLNHMITNFQFGYTEVRNRPTIISNATISGDDNTLKQNGVCVCVYSVFYHSFLTLTFKQLLFHHFVQEFGIQELFRYHILLVPIQYHEVTCI